MFKMQSVILDTRKAFKTIEYHQTSLINNRIPKMNRFFGFIVQLGIALLWFSGYEGSPVLVPDIVHQTYDYQSPNFFLFLSLLCVQRFLKPNKHILWVNDEGRFRKAHWESWQRDAKPGTWESEMRNFLQNNTIEVRFMTFPGFPAGKPELLATNKAHRSDFARMKILQEMGGVYLDTDAYTIQSLKELYTQEFSIAFDNIVTLDPSKPKRMNNGVLLSAPNASFLQLWQREYQQFNPQSFDYDSSVVPFRLATMYPDLLHVEMSRLSPISYGFQTALLADAITCGIFLPPRSVSHSKTTKKENFHDLQLSSKESLALDHPLERGGIWLPSHDTAKRGQSYDLLLKVTDAAKSNSLLREHLEQAEYFFQSVSKKLVLHLTMSQVR